VLPDRFANGDTANDTGGIAGGRLKSMVSIRPTRVSTTVVTSKGLIARLDYIKGMGFTAVWVGPVFKNKAVQGARAGKRRLSWLLDHRFHPGRSAFRHQPNSLRWSAPLHAWPQSLHGTSWSTTPPT
jgi:hypothetical protein